MALLTTPMIAMTGLFHFVAGAVAEWERAPSHRFGIPNEAVFGFKIPAVNSCVLHRSHDVELSNVKKNFFPFIFRKSSGLGARSYSAMWIATSGIARHDHSLYSIGIRERTALQMVGNAGIRIQ